MNIAEEVARKRASGVSPTIERRFIRESGSPSRRLSIPSKQTPWPTTFAIHLQRPYLATHLLSSSVSDARGRRPLVSALPNTLLRSCAEISVHAYSKRIVAHGLQLRFARRIQNMRFRSLVCVLTLVLGLLGLAQDAATDVDKGVKDVSKAVKTTTKGAARGTETTAKDVA